MRRSILTLFVLMPFFCISFFSTNAIAQDLEWSSRESMSFPRMDFGRAVVDGKIYLFGGYSGSVLSRLDVYDPATGIWRRLADMPTPRRLLGGAAVNGRIYAIGGWNFTGISDNCSAIFSFATEEYDPQTDSWSRKADFPMPPPFNSCAGNTYIGAAGAEGKVYVFIFNTQVPGTTATYEYDPISNSWDKTKSPVPLTYTKYSVVNWNDRIYVLGTENGFYTTRGAQLAEYDPINDLWIQLPSTSPGKINMALAANSAGLYAIGGRQDYTTNKVVSTIEYFDPLSNNGWEFVSDIPTPRFSFETAIVNNSIFALGGVSRFGGILSSVEQGDIPLLGITADAGPDQIVFDEIALDASQTRNPTGNALTYYWQVSHLGNPLYNRSAEGLLANLTELERGFYEVTLTVTDTYGSIARDTMRFSATGLKGDIDMDGDVDGFDLGYFSTTFGRGLE